MLAHIKKYFPQRMEELGESGARDLVQYGIQRSASYHIRKEPDVCKYVDIMVVFGRDFDCEPLLSWASSILNNPALPGPSVRVDKRHAAAVAVNLPKEVSNGES